MTISNFSVTPNVIVPGESVHVEFTLSVTSADTVNGLTVYGGNGSWFILYRDDSFTLAAGKSKKISFDKALPKNLSYVSQNMGSGRSLVDPMWAIVLGSFGSRAEVKNPITYLNMRCLPTIANFSMERATGGQPDDEGVNVLTTLRLAMADGASTTGMSLKLYYAQGASPTTASASINLTDRISSLLAGVTNSASLIPNTFSNGSDWGFLLVFGDSYEQTQVRISLPRSFANLHLSGCTTGGACFGGFSASTQGNPMLESYYPAVFYAGIRGVTDYSAAEVKTGGKWIDGKPIYRKVVTGKAGSSSSIASIDTIAGFGSLVSLRGAAYRASTDVWYSIPAYGGSSVWNDVYVMDGGVVRARSSFGSEVTFYVVIEYTKS